MGRPGFVIIGFTNLVTYTVCGEQAVSAPIKMAIVVNLTIATPTHLLED